MKRLLISVLSCGLAFGGGSLLAGCEDTLEHEKTVETKGDGSKVVEEKKTTANDSTGTVTKTETKDVKKVD